MKETKKFVIFLFLKMEGNGIDPIVIRCLWKQKTKVSTWFWTVRGRKRGWEWDGFNLIESRAIRKFSSAKKKKTYIPVCKKLISLFVKNLFPCFLNCSAAALKRRRTSIKTKFLLNIFEKFVSRAPLSDFRNLKC